MKKNKLPTVNVVKREIDKLEIATYIVTALLAVGTAVVFKKLYDIQENKQ